MSVTGIDVQVQCEAADLPAVRELQRYVRAALPARHRGAELTLRVVDAAEGTELNHRYRGRDGATNVLSFPFDAPPGLPLNESSRLLGDIVVCAPIARAEAHEQHKTLHAHVAHLVVHGVLHLLGHDHQDDDEAACMESTEIKILAGLGFADPYLHVDGEPAAS